MNKISNWNSLSHASAACLGCILTTAAIAGCGSSDPTGSGGVGTVKVTTWGEEYIEDAIPTDPGDGSGFVDGWTVRYEKFLVNFQSLEIADSAGATAATTKGSMLFDHTVPGVKLIAKFSDIEAKAWDRVSYAIAPVDADTELGPSVSAEDKQLMLDNGYSVYVAATASQGAVEKHYAWGFAIGTRYNECHSEQDGKDEAGLIVKNNSSVEVQLTIHGDHLYYDRLQASPDPAVQTSLRFDALAAADRDDDGEVTLEELEATPLDVKLYDPSGLGAATHGQFVTALARTLGHFRGEGECTISKL